MKSLPEIGSSLPVLPVELTLDRELEEFEGPILAELHTVDGEVYLEKWCSRDDEYQRSLIVQSKPHLITQYLKQQVSMLDLLTKHSSGPEYLVDRRRGKIERVFLVHSSMLPDDYLPKKNAFHDPDLRPR